jgi:hypothetical protein
MGATEILKARVTPETKARVLTLVGEHQLTEAIWLRQLIAAALEQDSSSTVRRIPDRQHDTVTPLRGSTPRTHGAGARVFLWVRTEDRLLLRERAAARGMASATYVTTLLRAHLRSLTPLPKAELHALKRSVAELNAIGKNLNQITRAVNAGNRSAGLGREDFRAMLKICEALRDNTKALIKANEQSWETGHAEPEH